MDELQTCFNSIQSQKDSEVGGEDDEEDEMDTSLVLTQILLSFISRNQHFFVRFLKLFGKHSLHKSLETHYRDFTMFLLPRRLQKVRANCLRTLMI